MNKNLFYAVVLLAIAFVGFSSSMCGDDPTPSPSTQYYVNVDQSEVAFEANGGSATVLVKSNTSWKISGIPDWLTVSPASGANDAAITLTATASSTTRNCTLLISTGTTSASINVSQNATPPGPNDDLLVGIWCGRTNSGSEVGQLTINSDKTASFAWYDDNDRSPKVTITYSWTKSGSLYRLNFIRLSGDSHLDDWDCDLQVTYINAQRIEVQDVWDGEVDDLTYIFQPGYLDLSKRTQYPEPYKKVDKKYIGVWMAEEEGEDDYWLCYQIINANGTGVYQEFHCDLDPFRETENEYAPMTWQESSDGRSLIVSYHGGGDYETWDISNINGTTWRDHADVSYKQTGYTDNPSIAGTWKWVYYDESIELVLNANKTGTYKYWDDDRLSESLSFSYTNTSTSLSLTSSQGTREFSIALLTFNRLIVSFRNDKGSLVGLVFKKQ